MMMMISQESAKTSYPGRHSIHKTPPARSWLQPTYPALIGYPPYAAPSCGMYIGNIQPNEGLHSANCHGTPVFSLHSSPKLMCERLELEQQVTISWRHQTRLVGSLACSTALGLWARWTSLEFLKDSTFPHMRSGQEYHSVAAEATERVEANALHDPVALGILVLPERVVEEPMVFAFAKTGTPWKLNSSLG